MSDKDPTSFLEWLGYTNKPNYRDYKWLGPIVGIMLGLLGLTFAVYTVILFIDLGIAAVTFDHEAIRNIGLIVAAIIGAPFIVWRAIAYQKQVDVAEQGHITDRINEAVKGLGSEKTVKTRVERPKYKSRTGTIGYSDDEDFSEPEIETYPDCSPVMISETIEETVPNLEVRIGAIYSLERIAQDSLRDHIQIMEILCAYVRENSPAKNLEANDSWENSAYPRLDIQTVITVTGRRTSPQIEKEFEKKHRLDFSNVDLSQIDFSKGNFSAALFNHCRIEGGDFRYSNLTGTRFIGSLLNYSEFFKAELRGTVLNYAKINTPVLVSVSPVFSIFMGKIYGISLAGADISAITGIGHLSDIEKSNYTIGTLDTVLPGPDDFDRKAYEAEFEKLHKITDKNARKVLIKEIYSTFRFASWVSSSSNEYFYVIAYKEFMERLELTGWPYFDE